MTAEARRERDIAVVGVACRFPAAADTRAFWSNLLQGVDAVGEIPSRRWDREAFYAPDYEAPNKSVSKWGAFLDEVDHFDARFFDISPREARSMDPQHRLLLQEAWHCIEDAAIPIEALRAEPTAVFVGAMAADYLQHASASDRTIDRFTMLGNSHSLLANRISYALGLSGPSLSIDAAHASSLVALHEARKALLCGECRYALAAGVNLCLHPGKYVSFSKARMLSPTGRCRTFDRAADGYVPGEGVAVVLLQPLAEALAAGNRVLGVLEGSATNHGGRSSSLTVPRVEAQQQVIQAAWDDAGVDPRTVTFVEAHGTGTPLGDATEIKALDAAFRAHATPQSSCTVGAVKTQIGHLEACSGLAGVVKVLLMMEHRRIPASLHFEALHPNIDLDASPLRLAAEGRAWDGTAQGELRAGVSSFGIGGSNAHVVLAARPTSSSRPESGAQGHPFVLSARTPRDLDALV
ncbi:MAG: polyketide synthase, partial [Acidobacteriota bacterium]